MKREFKAYAASGPKGRLEPFSFDLGPLEPEDVEIKVTHCGLCHSDLSMLDNEWGMSQYPFVPGHEVTGTVVALGEAVKGLKLVTAAKTDRFRPPPAVISDYSASTLELLFHHLLDTLRRLFRRKCVLGSNC